MVGDYELKVKTLTVKPYQHEAIINLKRGGDTIYDVVDRLLEQNANLCHIEDRLDHLGYSIVCAVETMRELKKEMMKNV